MRFSLLRGGEIVILTGCLCLLAGCKKSEKPVVISQVSGRVTMEGKPLPADSVIIFHPVSGSSTGGSSRINEQGQYQISHEKKPGIPVGTYKISISPPALAPEVKKKNEEHNTAVIFEALKARDPNIVKQKAIVLQTDVVPQKYWSPATSGLEIVVKDGDNTQDIQLIPAPQPSGQ